MRLDRDWINRLRLASGLVLLAFLTLHLSNHALGLISLEAMEDGRTVFLAIWRNPAGSVLLLASLATHGVLVLYSLYRRRTLRGMRFGEVVQHLAGFAIPPLVVLHVIATRIAHEQTGLNDTYAWVLRSLWTADPAAGLKQAITLTVAWTHGCLGVHYWLRLKPWYPRVRPQLYALALLLPILALLGFAEGGREVEALLADPAYRARLLAEVNLVDGTVAWIYRTLDTAYWGMAGFLALFVGARGLHHLIDRRRGIVRITYPDDRRVTVHPGTTVLEASRQNGIPHAAVCGGRGRCSTCRIRVVRGLDDLAPPAEAEQRVLRRVGAPAGVRLACQLAPTANVAVVPLLPPGAQPRHGFGRPGYLQGSEREIAILFADLRAFTKFSESKLPYDVVFIMNQYFRYMGTAIEQAGGRVDKFIGDGVMALFGLETGPEHGCRDALAAARGMAAALDDMNRNLESDLAEPMRIGIGLHVGSVIVGEMGYAAAVSVTAIGDPVNTASRLEAAAKEFGCQLVVSRRLAERAGADLTAFPARQIEIRGRAEPLDVHLVEDASTLPEPAPRPARRKAG